MNYEIEDADDQQKATSTITIKVRCLRGQPIAVPDEATTDDNTPVTVDPLVDNGNGPDTDPENDPLRVTQAGPADIGEATLNEDGTVTYTPDPRECEKICKTEDNQSYVATIPYTIVDEDDQLYASSEITITVYCARVPPVAVDDEDSTDQNSPTNTPVLQNDNDPDDPANRISINTVVTQPQYGSATPSNGGIVYNPTGAVRKCKELAPQYINSYTDEYTYNIRDTNDNLVSNDATVTITVRCLRKPPNANDLPPTPTDENTPVCVDVLDNDTDPEGDTEGLTIVSVGEPMPNKGSAVIKDCGIYYTPDDKVCEELNQASYTVQIEYTIKDSDDSLTDSAKATIVVECVRPPVAVDDGPYTTGQGESVDIPVTNNDYDPDGGNVRIETVVKEPSRGQVEILDDDTIRYTPDPLCCDAIAPAPGVRDTFTYTVNDYDDDQLTSNEATVTVDIICRRGAVTAVPDERTTPEDTPVTVSPLDNDTDEEGDPITLTEVGEPNRGTRERVGDNVKYTPEPCNEQDRMKGSYQAVINYQIEDRDDASTSSSTITVTVICNQRPTANDDTASTTENNPVDIDVTDNDTDPEDDNIRVYQITKDPTYGEVTITGPDTIKYTPSKEKCDEIASSYKNSYVDTFKYNVIETDTTERLESGNDATVTVTVDCTRTAPIARDDERTTDENTPVDVYPLTNDEDPEGGELEIISVEDPDIGTINRDGDKVTYTPGPEGQQRCRELVGEYPDEYMVTMPYTIRDADDFMEASAVIRITVTCVRMPPVADDRSYETDEETPIPVEFTGSDPEGEPVTIVSTGPPSSGTLDESGPQPMFIPDPDFCAENPYTDTYVVTIPFVVEDSDDQLTDQGTLSIDVTCIRVGPVANDDEATTPEDTPVDIPVLDNDSDQDNPGEPDQVTFEKITQNPTSGTVEPNEDGTVTYTPYDKICNTDENYMKDEVVDTFQYTVRDRDDLLVSEPATVTVTIECNREGPIARDDFYETDEDTPIRTYPKQNDEDPDGAGALELGIINDPENGLGTTEREQGSNAVLYTPKPDYCDKIYTDSYTAQYTYTVTDKYDDRLTAGATVYITVKCKRNAPVARDDEEETDEGVPVEIPILENDSDPDNEDDPSAVEIDTIGTPSVGDGAAVTENDDGTVTYTPGDNCDKIMPQTRYTDVFSYTIRDLDDNMQASATVKVIVNCDPNPPLAADDYDSTPEDTPVDIPVLDNDDDPEQEPLSVDSILTQPPNGRADLNEDGTITYTPDPDFCGQSDSFMYRIIDNDGLTDDATVTVLVTCVNDNPYANDDYRDMEPFVECITIDVLTNDDDGDAEPDSLIVKPGSVTTPGRGTATINDDNTIEYCVNEGDCGRDTFQYTAQDEGGLTATATVTIDIECPPKPAPIPPEANCDTSVTDESTPVVIDVLANDEDRDDLVDGKPMTDRIVTQPRNGIATINDDMTITYTPNPGFCGCTDRFVYEVIDEDGLTDQASVRVTVNCNKAPVANPDYFETDQGVGIYLRDSDLLGNDYDPEGQPISIVAILADSIKANEGRITTYMGERAFEPAEEFCGYLMFDYIIQDPSGKQASTTVTINVKCPPPPPAPCTRYNSYGSRYKGRSRGSRSSYAQQEQAQVVIDQATKTAKHTSEGLMGQYASYIVIAIITLLFNACAFFVTYMCCIRKAVNKGKGFGYAEGKVLDDSDNEIDDALNQDV